ncbi:DUF4112 domain-containing protein [Henriciella sp. AS95]|uniref:DUF4112 domain-containing protein n=1 Tax=Henriciella sp. AS95 TaxID=3135782 RepID=UPI00317FF535
MPTGKRGDIDRLARLLDARFTIPGTGIKYGLDSIIGLVPGVGDAITGSMGAWIIYRARQEGASHFLISRMIMNLLTDTVLGSVPLLGDIFDFAFRSNMKNARLLQRHLDKHAEAEKKAS